MRATRCGTLMAAAVALVLASVAPAAAESRPLGRDAYEARLFELVNAERARHGLRRLARGRCAAGFATRWADRIAREQSLRHQPLRKVMATCEARRAAENVGTGAVSPEAMLRMWMKSRRHRANILDPRATHVGLGARSARNGHWYAVQVFLGP